MDFNGFFCLIFSRHEGHQGDAATGPGWNVRRSRRGISMFWPFLEAAHQSILRFRSGSCGRRGAAQEVDGECGFAKLSLTTGATASQMVLNVRGILTGEAAQKVKLVGPAQIPAVHVPTNVKSRCRRKASPARSSSWARPSGAARKMAISCSVKPSKTTRSMTSRWGSGRLRRSL